MTRNLSSDSCDFLVSGVSALGVLSAFAIVAVSQGIGPVSNDVDNIGIQSGVASAASSDLFAGDAIGVGAASRVESSNASIIKTRLKNRSILRWGPVLLRIGTFSMENCYAHVFAQNENTAIFLGQSNLRWRIPEPLAIKAKLMQFWVIKQHRYLFAFLKPDVLTTTFRR